MLDDAFYFALNRWEDAAIKREERETGRIEGRAEGRAEGLKKGRAEGERKKQIEMAKKLLENNIAQEIILSTTGLTEEELENIDNLE